MDAMDYFLSDSNQGHDNNPPARSDSNRGPVASQHPPPIANALFNEKLVLQQSYQLACDPRHKVVWQLDHRNLDAEGAHKCFKRLLDAGPPMLLQQPVDWPAPPELQHAQPQLTLRAQALLGASTRISEYKVALMKPLSPFVLGLVRQNGMTVARKAQYEDKPDLRARMEHFYDEAGSIPTEGGTAGVSQLTGEDGLRVVATTELQLFTANKIETPPHGHCGYVSLSLLFTGSRKHVHDMRRLLNNFIKHYVQIAKARGGSQDMLPDWIVYHNAALANMPGKVQFETVTEKNCVQLLLTWVENQLSAAGQMYCDLDAWATDMHLAAAAILFKTTVQLLAPAMPNAKDLERPGRFRINYIATFTPSILYTTERGGLLGYLRDMSNSNGAVWVITEAVPCGTGTHWEPYVFRQDDPRLPGGSADALFLMDRCWKLLGDSGVGEHIAPDSNRGEPSAHDLLGQTAGKLWKGSEYLQLQNALVFHAAASQSKPRVIEKISNFKPYVRFVRQPAKGHDHDAHLRSPPNRLEDEETQACKNLLHSQERKQAHKDGLDGLERSEMDALEALESASGRDQSAICDVCNRNIVVRTKTQQGGRIIRSHEDGTIACTVCAKLFHNKCVGMTLATVLAACQTKTGTPKKFSWKCPTCKRKPPLKRMQKATGVRAHSRAGKKKAHSNRGAGPSAPLGQHNAGAGATDVGNGAKQEQAVCDPLAKTPGRCSIQ